MKTGRTTDFQPPLLIKYGSWLGRRPIAWSHKSYRGPLISTLSFVHWIPLLAWRPSKSKTLFRQDGGDFLILRRTSHILPMIACNLGDSRPALEPHS
ncbi:hypothetical protein BDV33DRAFT_176057, partial [Aspergillus novoparasiticus]